MKWALTKVHDFNVGVFVGSSFVMAQAIDAGFKQAEEWSHLVLKRSALLYSRRGDLVR
jgi:hypothetical protein